MELTHIVTTANPDGGIILLAVLGFAALIVTQLLRGR